MVTLSDGGASLFLVCRGGRLATKNDSGGASSFVILSPIVLITILTMMVSTLTNLFVFHPKFSSLWVWDP
ncbi:hypothetical protein TCAL_15724 [Tigriopus californicus]|uniref:Uncharacterized protein n=1 Tax=Tigriopus californicus TaxID=6832 RepID=A0A553P8N4_TIGCA|nr:hypothetical protein TCAL_15724 [Tigriopus californicus]